MKNLTKYLALALLCVGCAKEANSESQTGEGSVSFQCVADISIESTTKSDSTRTLDLSDDLIPTSADFALHLTGNYVDYETGEAMTYDNSYTSLDSYNNNIPLLAAGDYKAEISYGTITNEGANNPCFEGELEIEIVARKYDSATITASLSNSIISLETSEWFDNYYSQAQFTVTTSAGNEFTFTQGEESEMIFVAPKSTLRLKGSATNAQTGATVEFSETSIGTTAARTLSTIVVNADQAGGATLSITFDQTLTEINLGDIDLNPDNNEDVEQEA